MKKEKYIVKMKLHWFILLVLFIVLLFVRVLQLENKVINYATSNVELLTELANKSMQIEELERNLSAWRLEFGDKEWLVEDPKNVRSTFIEIEDNHLSYFDCKAEFRRVTGIEEKFYCELTHCSPNPFIAKEKYQEIYVECSCYCKWNKGEEKPWKPIPECKGFELCEFAKVKRVIDGDTLEIGRNVVRLALVDAPEEGEVGYEEAKDFAWWLCTPGDYAFIDRDDKQREDAFGRLIAVVYCDGKNLNAELLYNDLAVIDTRFCERSEFGNESWAKAHGC